MEFSKALGVPAFVTLEDHEGFNNEKLDMIGEHYMCSNIPH